ncbi:hypothetical protein Hbl1158_15375 (plasmid) [Halobaculum sp. CBA1158]|uniref:HalOD1 output domain-containing protein n=1 Tax=Halobaculum sp. CBA1158 TaxID=2904243 RepID=UPI001F1BE8A7|nr:HalOD1 output domain-containing protein [Halobaculum sp. CBA1158]UIP01516.1 hypothetical protein Hbl1158_15375 [Halobaculum sp. CBA1158]
MQPSIAVIEAVAAVTGRDPTALPPLEDRIDVDGLNDVLTGNGADDAGVYVSFTYAGVAVAVAASGDIALRAERE